MGGKKKGGGGKKKGKGGGKGGDDDEYDPSVLNEILTAKVQALKARLVLEQERRDNADVNVEYIRGEDEERKGKMDDDHQNTREMVTKMTQIYKSMEKSYNEKIENYEAEVEQQEKQKKQLNQEIQ